MTEPLQPMTDADIATARKLCETSDSYRELGAAFIEYVPQLLAEVDRLRAEQLRADCDALTMPAALAEIERLRSRVAELERRCHEQAVALDDVIPQPSFTITADDIEAIVAAEAAEGER